MIAHCISFENLCSALFIQFDATAKYPNGWGNVPGGDGTAWNENLWVVVLVKSCVKVQTWLLIGCTRINYQSELRSAQSTQFLTLTNTLKFPVLSRRCRRSCCWRRGRCRPTALGCWHAVSPATWHLLHNLKGTLYFLYFRWLGTYQKIRKENCFMLTI